VSSTRDRLRVSLAGYDEHRERTAAEGADPDEGWWYKAWAETVVPVLREVLAPQADGSRAAVLLAAWARTIREAPRYSAEETENVS
jgi:hypothetical protein